MENSNQQKFDVYELVTNRIIAQLEKGTVPWKIPWTQAGLPKNFVSGRPYNGINVWLLASLGFEQNLFISFNQLKALGGNVKKGEKACPVVFWKWIDETDEKTGEVKKKGLLRYYMVFALEQCEGIPNDKKPTMEVYDHSPDTVSEQIIEEMPNCPKISVRGSVASYDSKKDVIKMPKRESFITSQHFYGTLFHELIHSTGHKSRLNRKGITEDVLFGSKEYAMEELIAEMGASFLTSLVGFNEIVFDNQAAYIQNWLTVLKNDKRFIIFASGRAQTAVDYIMGKIKEAPAEEVSHDIEETANV